MSRNIANIRFRITRSSAQRLVTCITLAMVSTATATDLISPTSQLRIVEVVSRASDEFYYDAMTDADESQDFEAFGVLVSASATVAGAAGTSEATQTSTISSNALDASGGVEAFGDGWDFNGWADCDALSEYDVTFDITTPVRARVHGTVSAYDSVYSEVILVGPLQGLFAALAFGPGEENTFDEYFYLFPGEHRLAAFTSANVFGNMSSPDQALGEYSVTLIVCPAGDLDGDDTIGLSDLAKLLSYYGMSAGVEQGDLDNDGSVGLADLSLLLANYGSSCSLE